MAVMSGRLDTFIKSIIFPRPKQASYDTGTRPNKLVHIPLVDLSRHTETGNFTFGYFIENPAATHVLLYAHPNAVDIGMAYKELRYVSRKAGVSVLLFEYSGYGLTRTAITEASVHQDTLSAYLFLRRYARVPAKRILLCGRSIGASLVAFLAASLPEPEQPSLVVMQCPFTALSECINEFSQNAVSIANFLGYNWFRTIDIIPKIFCPVVLHHGTADTIVSIGHSNTLKCARDTAPRSCVTYFYPEQDKGHNNLSSDLLVRILRERVVTENLAPLSLPHPRLATVNPPVYERLFCDARGAPFATLGDAVASWADRLSLRSSAPPLDQFYVLLTASVCAFTMEVSRAWQVYCTLIKSNACGEAPRERCSKSAFLEYSLACRGSPLGIHVSVEQVNTTREVRSFGFATCRDAMLDAPALYSTAHAEPLLTVLEIAATPGLLASMKRCLSTAPDLLLEPELPCFVQPEVVTAIQLECERAVAFLSDGDRQRLCALLEDMDMCSGELLSSKARERLRRSPSKSARMGDESVEELRAWLQPWLAPIDADMRALAHEVPWDDYLLRCRSVAAGLELSEDMSWEECCDVMELGEVVGQFYLLFQSTSAQYLRPSFTIGGLVADES